MPAAVASWTLRAPHTALMPLRGLKIDAILRVGIGSTAFPIKRCGAAEA
jgi:hypothetical protein